MDGFQLAEQIEEDLCAGMPIVMMVTSSERGKVDRHRRKGITACLTKPIRQSELLSAVVAACHATPASVPPALVVGSVRATASRQLRILVAEDNPVNQTVIIRMLEKMGHLTVLAHNGREALSMLERKTFDLVFMDVQMPEMDGLTAARKIRDQEAQTKSYLPLIAVTAHAIKGDKERCLQAGMDAYISKPVTSLGIAKAIAEVISVEAEGDVPLRTPVLPSSSAPFDRDRLLEQLEGDESLLRELVTIFLEESPKQLASLQRAIEASNPREIEKTAHSLKGELGYLGLAEAAQRAKDIEHKAHEHSFQSLSDQYLSLQAELLAASAVMRSMLETGTA
jgi:CheY-like chemotaxis protein